MLCITKILTSNLHVYVFRLTFVEYFLDTRGIIRMAGVTSVPVPLGHPRSHPVGYQGWWWYRDRSQLHWYSIGWSHFICREKAPVETVMFRIVGHATLLNSPNEVVYSSLFQGDSITRNASHSNLHTKFQHYDKLLISIRCCGYF